MPNDDFRGYFKKLVIHCPSSASKGTGMCNTGRCNASMPRSLGKALFQGTGTTLLAAHVEKGDQVQHPQHSCRRRQKAGGAGGQT